MGRKGYDVVEKRPKKDTTFIRESSSTSREALNCPKKFVIIKSGEGLQNERGGQQGEFGYLIKAAEAIENKDANPSMIQQFLRERKAATEQETEFHWVAASILLQHFPLEVESFHRENSDAPKPYGFDSWGATAG